MNTICCIRTLDNRTLAVQAGRLLTGNIQPYMSNVLVHANAGKGAKVLWTDQRRHTHRGCQMRGGPENTPSELEPSSLSRSISLFVCTLRCSKEETELELKTQGLGVEMRPRAAVLQP